MSTMAAGAQSEGLIQQFETSARRSAATTERISRSASAIAEAVFGQVPLSARLAISDPLDLAPDLFTDCWRHPGVIRERTRSALSTTDAGLTEGFAAVARSGSICVRADRGFIGYVSLLPRLHIAVVDSSCIVERPRDLFSGRLAVHGLEHNFVYITGPSATADMGPLVRGVHGPHRLHVLLLI